MITRGQLRVSSLLSSQASSELQPPRRPRAAKKRAPLSPEIAQDAVKKTLITQVPISSGETSAHFDTAHFEPPNWRAQLDNIRVMRAGRTAAVDSMGASKCADKDEDPPTFRYQILLSLMLSSQTRDEVTSAAMQRLRDHGCTVARILSTTPEELGNLIYPVGFWKKKVTYIRSATRILCEKYSSDIPQTPEELMTLPGVGPKMAHLVMELAWGQVTGIAVDTHVHRISNRLGWTPKWTANPEQTRNILESWLPRNLWSEANLLLVGFGQEICLPQTPRCADCANREICPFARKERRSPAKKA